MLFPVLSLCRTMFCHVRYYLPYLHINYCHSAESTFVPLSDKQMFTNRVKQHGIVCSCIDLILTDIMRLHSWRYSHLGVNKRICIVFMDIYYIRLALHSTDIQRS